MFWECKQMTFKVCKPIPEQPRNIGPSRYESIYTSQVLIPLWILRNEAGWCNQVSCYSPFVSYHRFSYREVEMHQKWNKLHVSLFPCSPLSIWNLDVVRDKVLDFSPFYHVQLWKKNSLHGSKRRSWVAGSLNLYEGVLSILQNLHLELVTDITKPPQPRQEIHLTMTYLWSIEYLC